MYYLLLPNIFVALPYFEIDSLNSSSNFKLLNLRIFCLNVLLHVIINIVKRVTNSDYQFYLLRSLIFVIKFVNSFDVEITPGSCFGNCNILCKLCTPKHIF